MTVMVDKAYYFR